MGKPNNPDIPGGDPALWIDDAGNIRTMDDRIVGHLSST
jgi:hypothetical protein